MSEFDLAMSELKKSEMTYDVICKDSDDSWLTERSLGIGASDSPIILGLSSYMSPLGLYYQKTGQGEEFKEDESNFWGRKLESIVLEVFSERSKVHAKKHGLLLRSKKYPFLLATPDALTDDDAPVEIKTASAFVEGDWEEGCPEKYLIQVHQQMLVLGASHGFIACLIGGQRLVWSRIERDETIINKIIFHGRKFWEHVENRTEPEASQPGDFSTLNKVYNSSNDETVELDFEMSERLQEIESLKEQIRELTNKEKLLGAQVKQKLGSAERGFSSTGWGVSWKQTAKTRIFKIIKPKSAA